MQVQVPFGDIRRSHQNSGSSSNMRRSHQSSSSSSDVRQTHHSSSSSSDMRRTHHSSSSFRYIIRPQSSRSWLPLSGNQKRIVVETNSKETNCLETKSRGTKLFWLSSFWSHLQDRRWRKYASSSSFGDIRRSHQSSGSSSDMRRPHQHSSSCSDMRRTHHSSSSSSYIIHPESSSSWLPLSGHQKRKFDEVLPVPPKAKKRSSNNNDSVSILIKGFGPHDLPNLRSGIDSGLLELRLKVYGNIARLSRHKDIKLDYIVAGQVIKQIDVLHCDYDIVRCISGFLDAYILLADLHILYIIYG